MVMKSISLKINDSIFTETEKILSNIKISRTRYINNALEHYNHFQKHQMIEKEIKKESFLVREESMNVLREFEAIDYAED